MGYGYAYDVAGTKCTGEAEAGAIALKHGVLELEPWVRDLGIYNCRPPRGVTPGPRVRVSLHGEGRAWDAGVEPHERARGDALAQLLVDHALELGIQQVIWYRRQWLSLAGHRHWEPYNPGPGGSPHTDHVHVGLCWAAARSLTKADVLAALGDDQEDDDMPAQVLWFTGPSSAGTHAYKVEANIGKHLNRSSLELCRFLGVAEPGRDEAGGERKPLGPDFAGSIAMLDGPCHNIRWG